MWIRTKYMFLGAGLVAVIGSAARSAEPTKTIDTRQLAKAIEETQAKFNHAMATWTTVIEAGPGIEIHVKVDHAPTAQRYNFTAFAGTVTEFMLDLIVRDGVWYVWDGKTAEKYRPYEAPAELPPTYLFLGY